MPFAIFPEELVHLIVDACDSLADKREETLRSLCRLAKRYYAYAARALYARIQLHTSFKSGNVPEQGAALRAFLDVPGVHPYVRAIAVNINDDNAKKALDLLCLPNIREVTIIAGYTPACARVLLQGQTSVRRLVATHWLGDTFQLIADYPQAFSALDVVELSFLSDTLTVTSIPDLRLSAFTSNHPVLASAYTPSFYANLVCLTLPLFPELADYDLAQFSSLRRVVLSHSLLPHSYSEVIPHVKSFLATATSHPSLPSISFSGTFRPPTSREINQWYEQHPPTPMPPAKVPPASKDILDAIPAQIQHLFLDTSLLAAAHIAVFLVGPDCPPGLRSAHISGAVGAQLMYLLRQDTELARTFERQDRQVKTWASGWVENWY